MKVTLLGTLGKFMRNNFVRTFILLFFLMVSGRVLGQSTIPTAFNLSGGNYTLTTYSATTFPPNMAIGYEDNSTDGNFTNDLATNTTNGSAAGNWKGELANGISYQASGSSARGSFLLRTISTSRTNIVVAWTVRDITANANTNYIELQWRVGTSGAWNNVTGDLYEQGSTANGATFSITLPSGAENNSDLRIRWIYYEVGTGTRDRLAIDDITVSSSPESLCSGTPTPGNTNATVNPVVSGGTTVLSLQNATSGSGVSYQWQSSTTSATTGFSNISGATSATYTATVTAKTWYRCVVTCGGNSGTSNAVEINIISPPANDLCANAQTLTVNNSATAGTTTAGTMLGATATIDSYKDVWYAFTPTCSALHTVELSGFSGDMGLLIYSSNCPSSAFSYLYFSDGVSATTESVVAQPFNAGTTYFIRIRAWNTAAESSAFTILVNGMRPTQPASITANSATCIGSTVTFTAPTNANASSWTWTLPAGWSGTSTTNTIDAVVGPSGSISVVANNCYGSSPIRTTAFTSLTAPSSPSAISGNATVCATSVNTYNVTSVSGLTYTWTLPMGWTGSSTTASISATATASATSGTITVTATNACGTSSAQTFAVTVNAQPAAPAVPTSNSPQCSPGGVTLTQNATGAPAGEAWFWQTTATGTAEAAVNSATTYTATASGTIYIRSKNIATGCWSPATSLAVVVNPTISTTASSPSPSNNNGTVCYSGTGAVTALTWSAASGATSYDVYFGAGSMPATPTANVTSTSYAVTLLGSTTYHWKIVPRNGCGITTGTVNNWTFTTQTEICYCGPSTTWSAGDSEILNVSLLGELSTFINNPTSGCTNTIQNYTAQSASVHPGGSYTINVTFGDCDGGSTYAGAGGVWVDWNNDGDFSDAGETIGTLALAASASQTLGFSLNVPVLQPLGNYRARVIQDEGGTVGGISPCNSPGFGAIEDYTITVVAATTDTRVSFASATYTATENVGTTNLCINITNPSATVATSANVVVTASTGFHITATSYPITFPAGSSAQQCVALSIADNILCSDGATYTFQIQSVAGGTSATVGSINQSVLTVNDNDATIGEIRRLDFEGCNNWNYVTIGDALIYDDFNKYNGTYSMSLQNNSSITLNNVDLTGYSNVTLSVAFAAVDVDSADILYMDVSYDNGATWPAANTTALFSPAANDRFLNINTTFTGSVATNPYTINIPNGSTQVRVRFRATSTTGTSEYYYVDDIILRGNGCNVTPVVALPQNTPNNITYISEVRFVGTQNDVTNTSTFSTSPSGYQDFTGLVNRARQIQGEGVNIQLDTNGPIAMVKAWIDLNQDGDFEDSNELKFDSDGISVFSTTFGFTIPPTLPPGDYKIRIRIEDGNGYSDFVSCGSRSNAGETEDYILTVLARCAADVETVSKGERCGVGSVTLQASTISSGITEFRWYTTPTGGTPLTSVNSGGSTTFNTPSISTTTTYYVATFNGTCETQVRRAVVATVKDVPEITFTPAVPIACGDVTPIEVAAEDGLETIYLVDENFDLTGGLGAGGTSAFVQNIIVSNGNTINQISKWEKKTSTFVPIDGEDSWQPAISSGYGTNKFAFSTSDVGNSYTVDNGLELRNSINTTAYQNLTLKFRMYFSRYSDDNIDPDDEFVSIEVSINGGTTYAPLASPKKYITDIGTPGGFAIETVDLSDYINQPNLKFRLRYYSNIWADGVAVDDIQIFGSKTLEPSYSWSGSDISVYSDAAMTTPYLAGTAIDRVYVVPNLSLLAQPSFNISITTTLTNGCPLVQNIPVTNNSKVWDGTNTAFNNPNNWKPVGVPTDSNCIVIPDTGFEPIIPASYHGVAKTVSIQSNAQLTISSGSSITVTDEVLISDNTTPVVSDDGKLVIENTGSLVQVTNPPVDVNGNSINKNLGNIEMKRTTTPMYRYDFTYWSSPIEESPSFTLNTLSPGTLADKYYKWNTAIQNWQTVMSGASAMDEGIGYIVRAPQSYAIEGQTGATPTAYAASFLGKPNNGVISVGIVGGANKWNLLGNPYPSAISANAFITHSANAGLDGTLYFWTHNSRPVDTVTGDAIYNYSSADYAAYNLTGSTATATSASPEAFNPDDNNTNAPDGTIPAGQSFFVRGTATGTALFNNAMRVTGPNINFYRTGQNTSEGRVWLNLSTASGAFHQALVGYMQNATNTIDRGYDGLLLGGNAVTLYSILDSNKLTIQGRQLPFSVTDEVPLGTSFAAAGTYKISIDHFDGFFNDESVYLEDRTSNVFHDLKQSAYTFTSRAGTFDNRFVLRYMNPLSKPDFEQLTNEVFVLNKEGKLLVQSITENLKTVVVYDLLGREIHRATSIQSKEYFIGGILATEQTLLIQIELENGAKASKKALLLK